MFAKTLKIPDKQKNVLLLPCKCTPFEVQKDYIYRVKGLHLNSKRTPFEKPIYNPLIFNAFKNRDSLHFYQYFNTLHSIFNTLTPNSQCIIIRFSKHTTPLPTGEGLGVGLCGAFVAAGLFTTLS